MIVRADGRRVGCLCTRIIVPCCSGKTSWFILDRNHDTDIRCVAIEGCGGCSGAARHDNPGHKHPLAAHLHAQSWFIIPKL